MSQVQSKQVMALRHESSTSLAKSGVVEVNTSPKRTERHTKAEVVRLPPTREVHFKIEPYLGMDPDEFNDVLDVFPFVGAKIHFASVGLLIWMWFNCDPSSGVWWGSPATLAAAFADTTLKAVYSSMLSMKNDEFINYDPEHLSKDVFPVLLNKFPVRRGPLKGHVLDAFPSRGFGVAAYNLTVRGASAGSTNGSGSTGTVVVTKFEEGKVYLNRMSS
jgi:hypothetical protein